MLSDADLIALWDGGESDRMDFKESANRLDDIREYVCAFANDLPGHGLPGVLFIGVRNNGSCAGLTVTDDLLNRLSNIRDGSILPLPTIRVSRRILKSCEVVVLEVEPAELPPVRWKGRTWVRVGTTNQIATRDDERRLIERRRAGDRTFDHHPAPGATLDDLDLTLFLREYLPSAVAPEVIEENQRPIELKLKSLRFLYDGGVPNYGAILVLGKDPRQFVPSAYVQFLRLDGTDLQAPIKNQKEIDGPIPDLLRQLDDLLKVNIQTSSDIHSGIREIRQSDYPLVALQQLAVNAVMHRNYETSNAPVKIYWFSDRIEISNPGGLYGGLTPESVELGATDYRNPLLAEAMKNLGYVQRFGMGIPTAKAAMEKNSNPPPMFTFTENYTLVTLMAAQ
ncbi:MAG TPA: ATP-binding protein [Azospirillaceae bacterium]|nr:ATP-binding protein [Azospirillaceae bacterium]